MSEFPGALGLDVESGNNILTCDLPDTDLVIHLAATADVIGSVKDPVYDALTNIIGTIRLIKHYSNARFIFASSEGAIQQKIESPYGMSKFCAEEYIKLLHDNYVILRFPNIYGHPDSGSVVDIFRSSDQLTIYGDGSQTRDYVHVLDIVEAIKQSLTWPKGTYHLGSGKYHSVRELAEATGKPIIHEPARLGELQHTETTNNTPWVPKRDVLAYIKQYV